MLLRGPTVARRKVLVTDSALSRDRPHPRLAASAEPAASAKSEEPAACTEGAASAESAESDAPRSSADRGPVLGFGWSLLAALFAAGFLIPYRFAVESAPRLAAMTAMFVVAAGFNQALALVQVRRWGLDRRSVLVATALAVCTVVCNLAVALALPSIGTGMTSVVLKAQVVLTPVLAFWALGERVSGRFWAGATLALVGVALPALVDGSGPSTGWGYGWALAGAAGFATMQIITRTVIESIQPAAVNALRLFMAVAVLQLVPDGRSVWTLPASVWGYAALAGILGPGLSRLCLMAALRYVSPSVTALVALVGPILAFGLGAMFFGERPSAVDALGALLIVVGVGWPLLPSILDRFRTPGDSAPQRVAP